MTPEERQAALDNISAEDMAKIEKVQGKTIPVEPEDLLLFEFGLRYGWEAYKEARDDKININEMVKAVVAARKIRFQDMYLDAQAAFIGAGSAQSQKPGQTFRKMTDNILKQMEADK